MLLFISLSVKGSLTRSEAFEASEIEAEASPYPTE
jgi:hypothetical protein